MKKVTPSSVGTRVGSVGIESLSLAVNPVYRVIDVEVCDESFHQSAADADQVLGGVPRQPAVPRFLDAQNVQRIRDRVYALDLHTRKMRAWIEALVLEPVLGGDLTQHVVADPGGTAHVGDGGCLCHVADLRDHLIADVAPWEIRLRGRWSCCAHRFLGPAARCWRCCWPHASVWPGLVCETLQRGDHAAALQELSHFGLKDGGPLFVALNRAQLWTDHQLAP